MVFSWKEIASGADRPDTRKRPAGRTPAGAVGEAQPGLGIE